MHKKERNQYLKNNIKYLIKSRGESQSSLCIASGITRSTIYNILDGRVINVQQSTIRRISDFFGVSCTEIETVDLEQQESIEQTMAYHGNQNPAAVPVIRESALLENMTKRIGELATTQPLTYYFGATSNMIGVELEHAIEGMNEPGDVLLVRKGTSVVDGENLIYNEPTQRLHIVSGAELDSDRERIIGEIVEERVNDH